MGFRGIEDPRLPKRFVWSQVQASKLIESFLVGLPVPSIFLYTERGSENLLVVDGQQRLRSVFYYFEGLFGEERRGQRPVFRLKGISEESPYYGKTLALLTFLWVPVHDQMRAHAVPCLVFPAYQ
ncbi:MAG: DUF262 domain-containing protein, partial [Pseudonocardiaceae bacterium]